MNERTVQAAMTEAQRFIDRANEYMACDRDHQWMYPRQSGALRRASMDLTRSLADMRRYG